MFFLGESHGFPAREHGGNAASAGRDRLLIVIKSNSNFINEMSQRIKKSQANAWDLLSFIEVRIS